MDKRTEEALAWILQVLNGKNPPKPQIVIDLECMGTAAMEVIETFGVWQELKREPKGLRLWYWKWRIALRLARTIYRRSVYIVKPFGEDGAWSIATKISFHDREWKNQRPNREEDSTGACRDQP